MREEERTRKKKIGISEKELEGENQVVDNRSRIYFPKTIYKNYYIEKSNLRKKEVEEK